MIAKLQGWRARLTPLYGINRRNTELVHAHNPRHLRRWADDKLLCKQALEQAAVPMPRTLASCAGMHELEQAIAIVRALPRFVVKPARGSRGRGVLVLGELGIGGWSASGGTWVSLDELRRHIANIVFGAYSGELADQALLEERIEPHPFLHELWRDGLCDVRVLVLQGRAVMAMLRVPTARSKGRSNLHQGGIGVAVDLESGVTQQAVCAGRLITLHPETGVSLVGRQIPEWKTLVYTAQAAALSIPLGYVGVDISLDRQRGPLVIELNARPGLEIQNISGRSLGQQLGEVG